MTQDPVRWAERRDLGSLGEALRSARQRAPDAAHLERLWTGFEAAASAAPVAASAGALPVLAKLGAAGALALAGTGAWLALHHGPAPSTNPQPSLPVPTLSSGRATARTEAPELPAAAPDVASSAAPAAAPRPMPAKASPSSSQGALEAPSELELIRSARTALRQDPAQALKIVEQHARFFPGGGLAQEREVLAVEALAQLGRVEEARARAQRLLQAQPETAYRLRIERAVGKPASKGNEP